MAGNVSQWVADWYGIYGPTALKNPTGPSTGTNKLFRGGSWWNYDYNIRTMVRFLKPPVQAASFIGFRCAANAAP